MNNSMGLAKVLLVALAIPAVGFIVSFWIIGDMNADLRTEGLPSVTIVCDAVMSGEHGDELIGEMSEACQQVANIQLLGLGSIVAAIIGFLVPVMYWLASAFAGENRRRIAAVFPLILRLSILLIAASVLLQGGILTYAAYIGEAYAIGQVHYFLIGAVGIGALVGGLKLIGASLSFGRKVKMNVFGKVLTPTDAPQLFSFVQSLSQKLGARVPDNIIVGLEPTFYVTSSEIRVPGNEGAVEGETLYVSASLSRLLSQDEFASVIGHELGHFRGEDTAYSMRFAPVYAGLGKALAAIDTAEDEGASGIAKLPAIVMLSYMYAVFATNESKISRDREHEADEAGADAGSPLGLSTALIKLSLYSDLWEHASRQNIERLNQGKVARNLSVVFQDTAKYDIEHENITDIMRSTLERIVSHPTDTHPPISKRLDALGIKSESITKDMLLVPSEPAIRLIDNHEDVEKEITILEHQFMVALGAASPPEESDTNHLLHATYSLAAAMVCVDGKIDPDEVAVAEGIGQKFFEDFDSIEFREYCNDPEQTQNVVELAEAMGEILENEHKELITNYLRAISEADGSISEDEALLLQQIASGLGVVPRKIDN